MYNYTIIIPHKGIPQLLKRCLDTIPLRDDVQIVIVDDNSQLSDEDFASFPGLDRTNTEVIFTKEGRGAGYARNVGLGHAKGKWLIFADADDFFVENFSILLDKYVDSEADLIYFRPTSVQHQLTGHESERIETYLKLFDGDIDFLRYAYITPWGKFIKRDLIEKENIRFSEVRWGNDGYFMTQVGIKAQNIRVTNETLYVVDERDGSLTREKSVTDEEYACRIKQDILSYKFAELSGFHAYIDILLGRCLFLIDNHRWFLLCRVFHSLPASAYSKIRLRFFHQINMRGKLLFHALFVIAPFTKKLL